MNPLLQSLKLWIDPIPRSGPENMAVDEWLLETCDSAILRIYEWEDGWGSLGCFCRLNQAIESNDSLRWVRRSTGGGVVEHQNDWTYTLVIPETENLGRVRSAQSYQQIHELLTIDSINGLKCLLAPASSPELGGICFEKPVEFDVIDPVGNKLAGAGQRRSKNGLLHQGSVVGRLKTNDSIKRSKQFASRLSNHWESWEPEIPREWIETKIREKFSNPAWTTRR